MQSEGKGSYPMASGGHKLLPLKGWPAVQLCRPGARSPFIQFRAVCSGEGGAAVPGPQVQQALSNVYEVSESFPSCDLPPLGSVAPSSHCLVFLPVPQTSSLFWWGGVVWVTCEDPSGFFSPFLPVESPCSPKAQVLNRVMGP